jgi:hypothetical protein
MRTVPLLWTITTSGEIVVAPQNVKNSYGRIKEC